MTRKARFLTTIGPARLFIAVAFLVVVFLDHAAMVDAFTDTIEAAAAEGILLAIDVDPSWFTRDLLLAALGSATATVLLINIRFSSIIALFSETAVLVIFVRWALWTNGLAEVLGISDDAAASLGIRLLYGAHWWHWVYLLASLTTLAVVAVEAVRRDRGASN